MKYTCLRLFIAISFVLFIGITPDTTKAATCSPSCSYSNVVGTYTASPTCGQSWSLTVNSGTVSGIEAACVCVSTVKSASRPCTDLGPGYTGSYTFSYDSCTGVWIDILSNNCVAPSWGTAPACNTSCGVTVAYTSYASCSTGTNSDCTGPQPTRSCAATGACTYGSYSCNGACGTGSYSASCGYDYCTTGSATCQRSACAPVIDGSCASKCINFGNGTDCSASTYDALSPLCSSGTVTSQNTYTAYSAWACTGSGGGTSASGCSACAPGYSGVGCTPDCVTTWTTNSKACNLYPGYSNYKGNVSFEYDSCNLNSVRNIDKTGCTPLTSGLWTPPSPCPTACDSLASVHTASCGYDSCTDAQPTTLNCAATRACTSGDRTCDGSTCGTGTYAASCNFDSCPAGPTTCPRTGCTIDCNNPDGSTTTYPAGTTCPTWTKYCTPYNDINGNNYQKWAYTNPLSVSSSWMHVPAEDGDCKWSATTCSASPACGTTDTYTQSWTCASGLCSSPNGHPDTTCSRAICDCNNQAFTWQTNCSGSTGVTSHGTSATINYSGVSYYGSATYSCNGASNVYTQTSQSCIAFSCGGTAPSGGNLTSNSVSTAINQTWTYDGVGTAACKWKCNTDYHQNGTTCMIDIPAVPTGFSATQSYCSNNWINLSWNAMPRATSYDIYRDGGLLLNTASTAISDSGLAFGSVHSYTVRANNAGGSSAQTAAASVTVSNQCIINITKTGSGTGVVSSAPAGINCGATCSSTYAYNTSISLTPAFSPNSIFTGWSGSCSGTGNGTVIANTNSTKTCTANFDLGVCANGLTQDVTVACDPNPNGNGNAAVSGLVTRRQTKSAYPECIYPALPITNANSVYVSDNCKYNNATCGTITAPASISTWRTFTASVQMNNPVAGSKSTTWATGSSYNLGSQNVTDNVTWGTNRVALPSSVSPGNSVTFSKTFTAPAISGVQSFSWKMVQDGREWFGDTCSFNINVIGECLQPFTQPVTVACKDHAGNTITGGTETRTQTKLPYNNCTFPVDPYTNSVYLSDNCTYKCDNGSAFPYPASPSCPLPIVTNSSLSGNNTPNGVIDFTCSDTVSYTITRDGVAVTSGAYTGPMSIPLINFGSTMGYYTVNCLSGTLTASKTFPSYDPKPLTTDAVTLDAVPGTIKTGITTTLNWGINIPDNACTITASPVCPGGTCISPRDSSRVADANNLSSQLLSGNTDANDPYGANRLMTTALRTKVVGLKALGKKSLKLQYTTDFLLDCHINVVGRPNPTKKLRVQVTTDNEG